MEPQEIGLLMLIVVLFLAFLINYFDQHLKAKGKQRSHQNLDRRDDTSGHL